MGGVHGAFGMGGMSAFTPGRTEEARERLIDLAAREVDMDPAEFRRRKDAVVA